MAIARQPPGCAAGSRAACVSCPTPLCACAFRDLGIARLYGLPGRFVVVAQEETKMPKLKTKSGVKKRFKMTATGKLKHGVAGKRHRLISHNGKYIRQNRGTSVLSSADTPTVKLWAPYGLN